MKQATTKDAISLAQQGVGQYSEVFAEMQAALTYRGKTLAEWTTEYFVKVPVDAKTMQEYEYENLILEVARKLQGALANLSAAKSMASALKGAHKVQRSAYTKGVLASYQARNAKRPGADILKDEVSSYLSETALSEIASDIIVDFWKTRVESLKETKNMLESLGMAIMSRRKHEVWMSR